MDDANGNWVGYGPGDVSTTVAAMKEFLKAKFSYASALDDSDVYDATMVDVVQEMQTRYNLPATGIMDYATQVKCGFVPVAPPTPARLPLFFSVEGHLSNMFSGPVADTGTQLESEGLCHHQPIGYNNGAIPFDNASGENELARLFGLGTLDNGVPFPLGTKYVLGGYSQGMIVVTDFIANFMQPGQVHAPRAADCLGVLAYGNPCRSTGSVAPWSVAQGGPAANSGLDPYVRLDKLGIKPPGAGMMDVYRKGDLFADCEPGKSGEVKAAVYEAVARGDIFSNPASICAEIADLFSVGLNEVVAIFQAIVSGIGFLANGQGAAHYAPFDLTGGLAWTRGLLA